MSRIGNVFKKPGHTALIAYVTAGYPNIEATLETVPLLVEKGCDIIEIGIPFSDPVADGPTIQNSSYHALQNGVTPETCLELAATLRKKIDTPLIFMSYYNPIFHYGIEKFCRACSDAGVDGLIIPDLPPEEGTEIEEASQKYGVDLIYLLAPTSNEGRIKVAADHSRGFVYLVSITGVTGARTDLPSDLREFIGRVRKYCDKPLCLGFGISTPEQAKQAGKAADGVIVGSRIIQCMASENYLDETGRFITGLREALDSTD